MELPKGIIFDLQDTLLVGGVRHPDWIETRSHIIEDLAELRGHGVELGVITTAPEDNARILLEQVGAAPYIKPQYIIGRDSVREVPVVTTVHERRPGLLGKLGATIPVERVEMRRQVVNPKPSPQAVNFLLREWGLAQPEVLFVGDAYESDGFCARAAGVDFAQIPPLVKENIGILEFLNAA